MAKAISQDTFNDVVRENMEEFDMTEDEAVADAVQQFDAQGVNLANIIKSPRKAQDIKNRVEELVQAVQNKTEVLVALIGFSATVNGEISYKLLAASLGAYPVLVQCLKEGSPNIKRESLNALIVLMDGYPDILDDEGLNLMLDCLETEPELTLKWIQVSVKKHETNRSKLIRNNIAKKLRNLCETCSKNENVIDGVCSAIQVLILDDDVRVVHGDAHEHARTLATELLPLLASLPRHFISDENVTWKLLEALSSLLVRNEFCITFYESHGLDNVLEAMLAHPNNEKVARSGLLLLKNLAGSDEVKEKIIAAGAAPIVITTLDKHYKNSNLAIAGCMCYAALTLRSPSNSVQLAAASGPETLIRCLEHWKSNKNIMKHGCSAIRNQVSRCTELREEYRNLQVEHLLTEAKKLHGDLGFEAKSVLLDLGCDVKLNEEWKGTGRQLDS